MACFCFFFFCTVCCLIFFLFFFKHSFHFFLTILQLCTVRSQFLYLQQKNIGNRANNLYPQEWKIKSSHGTGELFIVNSL